MDSTTCLIVVALVAVCASAASQPKPPGLVKVDFVFQEAPFDQCHASTIEETAHGRVAAWFGGRREGDKSVGIWLSRHGDNGWAKPVEVADGVQADGTRFPCWNPVLFQPRGGPLMLFYKVGPNPRRWWGMLKTSTDAGQTWSEARRLPEGILGPVKNKPIQLPDGTILAGSSTEHRGWRVHFEISRDGGETWTKVGPVHDGKTFGAIQPTLLTHPDDRIQALCRSRQRRIVEVWSSDRGKSWSDMQATTLPNPNAGIDGVTLADGRQLLVYNHTAGGRSPLNVAVSADGERWQAALVLEDQRGEFSYPAVIQAADGRVHATYTWRRWRVKHVALDPARLRLRPIVEGKWPR
ncbi:MAG: sialidase family protein [Planctomycetota bacterium]